MVSLRARLERLLHPGYSWCLRCKRPWPRVKPHITHYTESRGCFPLCEACWKKLGNPEARLPFYAQMYNAWIETSDPELWPQIEAAVRAKL